MTQPDPFDDFYRDARRRLLAQTFALTGDLPASRRAVRDAFVVAWARWRRLSRLEDPEAVVRPQAWRLARRRHSARVLHREKDLDPGVADTLEALGKLTADQRRALVLTRLAGVPVEQMAREIALPAERADLELQAAGAVFAHARGVDPAEVPALFEALADDVEARARWPRTTIVRRAGSARRRTHTALGAAAIVATLAVSGTLVAQDAGARPTLSAHEGAPEPAPATPSAPGTAEPSPAPTEPPVLETLPASTLLQAETLDRRLGDPAWRTGRTDDNSDGTGLLSPCQRERYADPDGTAALVRRFRPAGRSGPAEGREAVQLTEASRGQRGARRAFRTVSGWYADCSLPRMQLLATRTAPGIGDESVQLVLRSWSAPVTTYVVGVARTGAFTTTTVLEQPGAEDPDRAGSADLLSDAVGRLCALPDAGACSSGSALEVREPLPAGPEPALISELDLPPVGGVGRPWVGTEARRPTTNAAATRCDQTSFDGRFRGADWSRGATRTFLIPEADLPQEFGLTETVGALPGRRAAALLGQVRDDIAGCAEGDLATDVTPLLRRDDGAVQASAWRLEIDVSDNRTLTFFMAVVRDGTSVAQVGFVPAGDAELPRGGFVDLTERALARLARLPAPRAG